MEYLWATLLSIVVILSWLLTLLGLPGNWIMIAATVGYILLVPAEPPLAIGWVTVVILLVLASIGELLEFLAGALGATKAGGSKRGAVLALAGSIVGGVVGLFVGVPIPIVGSFVAAVLFAGAGAFAGAVLGEHWKGREFDESLKIGESAFWGRLLGTLAKTVVGAVMVAVTAIALVL